MLAPTGTIGFMMDCDTTGVEPDIALVKYKKLVGGGMMKIVNSTVPMALDEARLHARSRSRTSSTTSTRTRRSKARRTSRTSTWRCSTARSSRRAASRSIHYMGHIKMMGAVQPFISGAISQDRQRAEGRDGRGDRAGLHRLVAHRRQGRVDLPRRQQAHAAAQHVEGQARRPPRRRVAVEAAPAPPQAARTSGSRSPTSSTSPATRATSPSASTRTASPASSS